MVENRSIRNRIIRIFGGIPKTEASRNYMEGFAAGYNDSGEDEPIQGTTKKMGYRSMTGGLRDYATATRENILSIVWSTYQSSPMAKRLLDIKKGYIMGGGITPVSKNTDVNDVIIQFWKTNELNKLRSKEFCLQLFLFGSQVYPAFRRGSDGRIRIGYIDPGQIEEVITHPENSLEVYAVVIRESHSSNAWESSYSGKKVYRIIRVAEPIVVTEDGKEKVKSQTHEGLLCMHDQITLEPWETKMLNAFGLTDYSGSCFYTKVNTVSNQPYGYSDLLQNLDWIDIADNVLFALGEREQMAGYFSFDVTIKNADDKAIQKRASELRNSPPVKGSVNLHNDAETWNMHSPDLKQAGSVETFNSMLTFILGGMGYPRHWYGYGDETNRATAEAQGDPTWRSLEESQSLVRDMFIWMCEFARDQAIIAGVLHVNPDDPDIEIDIPMPEMTTRDVVRVSSSLGNLAMALVSAIDNQFMTRKSAMQVWANVIAELGVEIDPTTELEAILEEIAAEEEEEEQKRQDDLLTQLELAKLNQVEQPELQPGEQPQKHLPPEMVKQQIKVASL